MFVSNSVKNIKYYLIALVILIIGAVLLNRLLSENNQLEQQKIEAELKKAHTEAINNAKSGIQVYATLVSSIKSYTKNSETFPSEKNLQIYLKDLLGNVKFDDSILVNYIDKDHVFKYVVTPNQIDPQKLKGTSGKSFLSPERTIELEQHMLDDKIRLFTPINLREGWTGFPFNFSARNNKNEILGYFSPVINVKYLLDFFYTHNQEKIFLHKFIIKDSFDLTREGYYNDTKIYSEVKDEEYYKNYNINDSDYIYSSIDLFGLELKVGSAFKIKPQTSIKNNCLAFGWYAILSILVLLSLSQYLKNRRLNQTLKEVNNLVVQKNDELEINLSKIQTLIKEIHHRIKNNMQMVAGILLMQENEYEDENIKQALKDSQNRIRSMSLVHEKLYGNTTLKDVKTKEYVEQLLEYVEDTVKNKSMHLLKEINIDDGLFFDAETASDLGLILNELVTNSFKYSFKDNVKNKLSITIIDNRPNFKLIYKDYGEGLSDDFNYKTSDSLGMELINILTEQLQGKLEYKKLPESTFIINFKPHEKSFHS